MGGDPSVQSQLSLSAPLYLSHPHVHCAASRRIITSDRQSFASWSALRVVGRPQTCFISPSFLSMSLHLRPSQAPPSHLCFFDIVIIGLQRSHPSSSTAELIALMFFSSVNLNQSSSLIFSQCEAARLLLFLFLLSNSRL